MGNPFEHEEIMRAAFAYGETRTVDEVIEAQRLRHEEQQEKARIKERSPFKRPGAPTVRVPSVPTGGKSVSSTEMAKLAQMLGKSQPVTTATE